MICPVLGCVHCRETIALAATHGRDGPARLPVTGVFATGGER
ncbi:MAG TPA: hypothetical protein VMD92_00885 [Acidobacteriaceae bacterium]|nr:hypothetical protein [Acidobacteriaceae bacterium]